MTTTVVARRPAPGSALPAAASEPPWVRRALIAFSTVFLGVLLVLPLAIVAWYALAHGWRAYGRALLQPDAMASIRLTLLVAAIVVPINTVFGVVAAWALGKFEFRGKGVLITLVDLPFSVSPVVAGLVFVLLFGRGGLFGPWLQSAGIQILYAVPGIVLATLFITLPFVVREVLPVMEIQGSEEEQAARLMGAGGLTIFFRVTLPNVKWGLLYGVILCNARAMGEFGAVSVVSGHIRGLTNTLPLQVEVLYNEYQFSASFALASLLTALALVTLLLKTVIETRTQSRRS